MFDLNFRNPTAKSAGKSAVFVGAGTEFGRFPESASQLPSQPYALVPPSAWKREKQKAPEEELKIVFLSRIEEFQSFFILHQSIPCYHRTTESENGLAWGKPS